MMPNKLETLIEILVEAEKIIGETLGDLSSDNKPWRELKTEELQEIDRFVSSAKKVRDLVENITRAKH